MVAPYVRAGRDSDIFPPAGGRITAGLVGSSVRFAWGSHRSRRVIEDKHKQLGLPVNDGIVDRALAGVEAGLADGDGYPNFVLEPELEQILQEVSGAPALRRE
jgi:hypothetical protein